MKLITHPINIIVRPKPRTISGDILVIPDKDMNDPMIGIKPSITTINPIQTKPGIKSCIRSVVASIITVNTVIVAIKPYPIDFILSLHSSVAVPITSIMSTIMFPSTSTFNINLAVVKP